MQNYERVTEKTDSGETVPSPFFLNGVLEYNKKKWDLEVRKVSYTRGESNLPRLDVITYVDKRGRYCLPLWVSHLAIRFQPSPTSKSHRMNRQWLDLAKMAARDMHKKGISGPIVLPPEITDARPWKWIGFNVGVRYTYVLNLPFLESNLDRSVRNKIKKAMAEGYTCSKTTDVDSAMSCLIATGERNGFDLQLTSKDLNDLRELIGDDVLRIYAGFDKNNEMVSVDIALFSPGSPAVSWIGGSKTEHLKTGAVQLTYKAMFDDLQAAGAAAVDLTGANMESIASMKADWGGRLVSYFVIEPYDLKSLYVWIKTAIRQRMFAKGGDR